MTARCGEVWLLDLDPTLGHEQAWYRPALVLSSDRANAAGMVTVLPLTSKARPFNTRIAITPPVPSTGSTCTCW